MKQETAETSVVHGREGGSKEFTRAVRDWNVTKRRDADAILNKEMVYVCCACGHEIIEHSKKPERKAA